MPRHRLEASQPENVAWKCSCLVTSGLMAQLLRGYIDAWGGGGLLLGQVLDTHLYLASNFT